MNNRRIFIASLCVLGMLTGLTACTSAPGGGTIPKVAVALSEITGQNGRACVRTSDIDGYGLQDNSVITIRSNRKMYIATTLYQCQFLDTAFQAAFDTRFSELCGGGRGRIVTESGSCPIYQIFEFESRKAAFAALDKVEHIQELAKNE